MRLITDYEEGAPAAPSFFSVFWTAALQNFRWNSRRCLMFCLEKGRF